MKRLFLAILLLGACSRPIEVEKVLVREEYRALTEWEVLELALILTESKGNPDAVGKTNDKGALQITPVFVAEANRISGKGYTHDDAFSVEKSLEMFSIVQARHNPDSSIDRAISLHNKGAAYAARVKRNMEIVRRMEAARKAIVNQTK